MRRLLGPLLAAGCAAVLAAAASAQPQPQPTERFAIGYLEIKNDRRYDPQRVYARLQMRTQARPFVGAEVALDESQTLARAARKSLVLVRQEVEDAGGMAAAIETLRREQQVQFFVVDAPATVIDEVGRSTRGKDVLLFNVTASEDRLRGPACQPHVMHVLPSESMLMDALVQYLISKKWRDVMVLAGPLPEDAVTVAAFERAAKRFGARIIEKKAFVLGNDPRQRELNNVALMTASTSDYDAVFVADAEGEFARYVPYATNRPRPVVGATGLAADAWHWSFERQGAPQVNSRFEAKAGRRMTDIDWAAWIAVKAIVQGVARARPSEFGPMVAFLKSETMRLDGTKGTPMNFRPWNNQLRQPLLLTTHNAVIERAPIQGFLHQTHDLDTLGEDKPDTTCKF